MKNLRLLVVLISVVFASCTFYGEGSDDQCQSNADCTDPTAPICNVGAEPKYCTQCLEDAHCDQAAGEICNTTSELCEEPGTGGDCNPDGTCGAGEICLDDSCTGTDGSQDSFCDGDDDCDAGLVCDDPSGLGGTCQPDDVISECGTDGICGVGLVCVNDECVDTDGSEGSFCDQLQGDCDAGLTCVIDENGGICTGGNNTECTVDEDCGSGFLCENNQCVLAPACDFDTGNGECSQGFYCDSTGSGRCARTTSASPFCDPTTTQGNDCSQFGVNSSCFSPNPNTFLCSVVVVNGCNTSNGAPMLSLNEVCGAGAYCAIGGCRDVNASEPFCDAQNDCTAESAVGDSCVNSTCQ